MKSFVIALLFSATIAVSFAEPASECPAEDGEYITLIADLDDCASFYECAYGKPVKVTCPANTYYQIEKETCDYIKDVDCGSRPIPQSR